jgi:hypothetical protein
MKAYQHAGEPEAAERVYMRHVAALEVLDLDDVAESTFEVREAIRRSVRKASA